MSQQIPFRNKRFYEDRVYEGEYLFQCGSCQMVFVFYAFEDQPDIVEYYLSGRHSPPCNECGNFMEWAGWSGDSDITSGLVSLLDEKHYMAAIAILAAFVEYQIDNLLWAVLVDSNLPREKATAIANGTVPRGDAIRIIRDLLGYKVKNISIPIRNEVVHGRAFGRPVAAYAEDLWNAFIAVKDWAASVRGNRHPTGYNFGEIDRWILSMDHWVAWYEERLKKCVSLAHKKDQKATTNLE